MTEHRFPGYDVLAKRNGMSWNDVTRRVIDERLAVAREPKFFSLEEWRTLEALSARIIPQPKDRPPVPLAAYIDQKMLTYGERGTRIEPMPWDGAAWKIALHALEAEAQAGYGEAFHELPAGNADALLHRMQKGQLKNPTWGDVAPELFFAKRVLTDIPAAYYAHPTAWSEMGFGGPASPRGYVRMEANRRDPWEAAEAKPGQTELARLANRHVR
jgi:hypothetical protein